MIGLLEIYEILIGSTLVLFGWDTWGYLTRFVTLGGYTMPLVVWVEKRSVLMLDKCWIAGRRHQNLRLSQWWLL